MKLAKHIYLLYTVSFLLFIPVQLIKADEFYTAFKTIKYQSNNLTQSNVKAHEFELSEGQVRSRVEHTLINYLLGKTVDQYIDFGAEDETAKKSTKQLKLRVNKHRLMLVYRLNLNL